MQTCSSFLPNTLKNSNRSNVEIVQPLKKSISTEEKRNKRTKNEKRHSTSEDEEELIVAKPDEDPSLHISREKEPKHADNAIEEKLVDLARQIAQYQKEQKEQQLTIQQYMKELELLKSHQDKCSSEETQKNLAKQQIDLLEQLEKMTPISTVRHKDDHNRDQSHVDQLKAEKKYDYPLVPRQKVLALCSYNGWYEEGTSLCTKYWKI
ncbi:Hypothetical predicted protein [Pelobates cultripes]|uniref:Uncharacterized protein n=1 Tax=Pelobates cultripes TaxID=61616 RepID=A0AAD1R4V6_PELCU|nr:Hypothetical predicted protein [Pelobates cultripes]